MLRHLGQCVEPICGLGVVPELQLAWGGYAIVVLRIEALLYRLGWAHEAWLSLFRRLVGAGIVVLVDGIVVDGIVA